MSIKYKMGVVKLINIKNRTYYFYSDMIDLENFDGGLLNVDKKSYKNIDIYYIEDIIIKKKMMIKNVFIA